MSRIIESFFIDGPAGRIEAILEEPGHAPASRAALLCHPHPKFGGTMHNKVMYRLARGLRGAGAVALRFNFRGVNLSEGEFSGGDGELEDARAALAWLRGRYPSLPHLVAGFSFGSRIAQRLACGTEASKVIAVGFPTVAAGREQYLHCATPRVFVHSTSDIYGPREEFEQFYAEASGPKELVWIEAEDHFFRGSLDKLEEVATGL